MHYVISACFILHNICLNNNDDFLFETLENEILDIEINNTNNGNLMRDYLSHLLKLLNNKRNIIYTFYLMQD